MTDSDSEIILREVTPGDLPAIWAIFEPIVAAGETYAYPRDTTREECQRIWMDQPQKTLVAETAQGLLGTYFLKPNAAGPGGHVCNCGYMVAPEARGRGLAAAMCVHSQDLARVLGYKMMQFNAVVATNTGAIALWHRLGFDTVGRVPRAFAHPTQGFVDIFVMAKWLGDRAPG